MATIVAASGGGNWTAGATWVGGTAPTAADDAVLSSTSGAVTANAGSVCRSLDCTGYSGTLTISNVTNALAIGNASGGALTFVSGMTLTLTGGGSTAGINFVSTSDNGGTGWSVTTAGKTMPNLTFNGAGGKWVFQGSVTATGRTITLTAGTLDTNSQTVTMGAFSSSNTNTRTLTLGSSSITCTLGTGGVGWVITNTGLTTSAASSTITLSGTGATFQPGQSATTYGTVNMTGAGVMVYSTGNVTLTNLTRTGTASKTDGFSYVTSGSLTVTGTLTLNGNSATNRLIVYSSTIGTARTITAAAVVASNVDFADITGAGAGNWDLSAIAGGSGDALGNSGITFTAPATQTWQGTSGGDWSDVTKWTSRVPLPQDNVIFSSAFIASQTVYTDMPRLGANVNWTGSTGAPRLSGATNTISIFYGDLILASSVSTQSLSGNSWQLQGRGTHTLTPSINSIGPPLTINAPGGTYNLSGSYSQGNSLTVAAGTFNTNNHNITVTTAFVVSSTSLAIANLGTSTFTLVTAGTTTVVNVGALASISAADATFIVSLVNANTRTFAGGGNAYGELRYTVATSTGQLTISGNNHFKKLSVGPGRTLALTAGSSQNVDVWDVNGTAGSSVVITSTTAAAAVVAKPTVDSYGNKWRYFGTTVTMNADAVVLPGTTGNYPSAADSAALSIAGDIDVRCRVSMPAWVPGVDRVFVAKRAASAAASTSYVFYLDSTGLLRFITSNGSVNTNPGSTVTTGVTDGAVKWVRVTWRRSDGRVQFFLADGALTNPVAADFIQLGGNLTSQTTDIIDCGAATEIGSQFSNPIAISNGTFYAVEIRNGIDGTLVADPRFGTVGFNGGKALTSRYSTISASRAIGAASWTAPTSVDGGTNYGWVFNDEPPGQIKMWDGAAWVGIPLNEWDGSAWVERPVKHFDGTVWRLLTRP